MSSALPMTEDFNFAGPVNRIPKVGGKEKEIGTKFDCSTDRGTPFNTVNYERHLNDEYGMLVKKHDGVGFANKDGRFCLALSMAVKTMMMKGDKVTLTVKPQYGFRENGKSTHSNEGSLPLPPNSTLQVTLELVSWRTASEVTVDKKVVEEGKGYECSNEGAVVKLKLIGKLQDGNVSFKKGYNDGGAELLEFKTNEVNQMIDELDRAVSTMKKGDVALLTIEPEYSFGSSESQNELDVVPPNSTLYYDVEQVSIVENKGSWEMISVAEKLPVSGKKHEGWYPLYREHASAVKTIDQIEYDYKFCVMKRETPDIGGGMDIFANLEKMNKLWRAKKDKDAYAEKDKDTYANFYRYMFNKMKSWILTVIKPVQRMLKPRV